MFCGLGLKSTLFPPQLDVQPTRLIEAKNINKEEPILGSFKDLFNILLFYVRRYVPINTVRLDIKVSYEHKKAWELPVVCPTDRGLRIARYC